MPYNHIIRGQRFVFDDLRQLLAKANEAKSGDQLAGLAARSELERAAAKLALADVPIAEIVDNPVVDSDHDNVSRLILDGLDRAGLAEIGHLTVGGFREFLLAESTDELVLQRLALAIAPELAAAVAKLMSNKDLVLAASKMRIVTRCRNTMGERGVFGIRIQPNHPGRRPRRASCSRPSTDCSTAAATR